jgi:hypothetical protein
MSGIKIYGSSDDLVEIEGEIEDEVGLWDAGIINIECSDGTKATIEYQGTWNIKIDNEGSLFDKVIVSVGDVGEHTDPDAKDCSSYSDVLVLKEGTEWVKINNQKISK